MRKKYKLQTKLNLPTHFKHIYNLFCSLDTYLNLLKRRRGEGVWTVTHSELSKMIEHSLGRNFKYSHYQQILTVCPLFFIDKWEHKHNKLELLIEIPNNI